MTRIVALLLTAMTGFSGLVYEVAWQKYLATLLGSHSEATAAVLAIFLGGLSIGYWLFGWFTRRLVVAAHSAGRPPRLLFVYGMLETSIGVYVIAFPWLFKAIQALSFAIPHGASGFGFAIDVLLTVLLIGPASVLMGGTIPILTQALAKSLEDATRFHAFVYAFNTAGAFAGALAAGFYLIPVLGLVTVMLAMGVINLFAGSVFMLIGRKGSEVISLSTEKGAVAEKPVGNFRIYGVIALLTGFAMMAIQIVAIRVAGLSFGSSQFTFSMVVAVFVLCIALGSFGVSSMKRIPRSLVVANQWALGGLFTLLYFQVSKSPYWVHMLRSVFRDSDSAFVLYYTCGFLALLLFVGLPIMLSGAVLPLLFHLMRREADHLGDLAGNLYSWNTVGSLVGALLGGYILYFWFDLHHIYRLAVAALALSAVLLTIRVYDWRPFTGAIVLACAVGGLMAMPAWDYRVLNAGLFRAREAAPGAEKGFDAFMKLNAAAYNSEILFHVDDPIASVMAKVVDLGSGLKSLSIVVNGKSDGNTYSDYPTMSLAATIPALLAAKAERGFIIGWGTGVTAGELAALESIERVDVAEISPGVIQAAPYFDFANLNATQNPKIHIIESDAYRALMRSEGSYDVIVSEPSNPWVTGSEMLFSREFLEVAKRRLSPGGVYCQWLQEYETDQEVIEIVLRTYASVFDHVAIWRTQTPDLLLLGFDDPKYSLDHFRLEERANRPDFKRALRRSNVKGFPELLSHELVPLGVVHAMALEGPIHTLYHPVLNNAAGRAFFRGETGNLPFSGYGEPAKVGRKNSLLRRYARRFGGQLPDDERERVIMEVCRAHGIVCHALLAQWKNDAPDSEAFKRAEKRVKQLIEVRDLQVGEQAASLPHVKNLNVMTALFAGKAGAELVTPENYIHLRTAERASREFKEYYYHGSPFDSDVLDSIWSQCAEVPPTREWCEARVENNLAQSATRKRKASIKQCMKMRRESPACREGKRLATEMTQ